MIHLTYLSLLVVSIVGMIVIDRRWKLALFHDWKRTLLTVGFGVGMFLIWDILGIQIGIFFIGNSPYDSGILLAPELPIEELLFLTLLCYLTLILYRGVDRGYRHLYRP